MSRVPQHVAAGRRPPFPAGTYIGDLVKVTEAWSQDQKTLNLLFDFANVTPVEGKDVGARHKLQRVTVIANVVDKATSGERQVALAEVEDFSDDSLPMSIQRAASLMTQLGLAFGVADVAPGGDVDVNFDALFEDLLGGVYTNHAVMFEVENRKWKSKTTGNEGTSDDIIRFQAAEEDVPADAAPEVAAPEPTPAPAPAARQASPRTALSGARTRK